jgi:hypothetical protein
MLVFTRAARHFSDHTILIIDLNQGDDRAPYELIGKMIKKIDERISLSEVIEQLTTKLHTSRK